MTPKQVVEHFNGRQGAADALGLTYEAVRQWLESDRVPMRRQYEYERLTDGVLKADSMINSGHAA